MSERNTDCPESDIITTMNECKAAVVQLGFNWRSFNVTSYIDPAGCYTWSSNGGNYAYFNNVIDPSSTSPDGGSTGICRSGNFLFVS